MNATTRDRNSCAIPASYAAPARTAVAKIHVANHQKILLFTGLMLTGLIMLAILFILSLASGPMALPFNHTLMKLVIEDNSAASLIIHHSRLPRTLVAMLVGAAFAVAGTLMQGVTRNPLACPTLFGINQGAAFSMLIMLIIFPNIGTEQFIPIAFMGGLSAAALIYVITSTVGLTPLRLALAGVTVNALLHSACRALLILFPDSAQGAVFSVLGSVAGRGWLHVEMITPWILGGLLLSLFCGRTLNILSLGNEQAIGLGLKLKRQQILLMLLAVLLSSAAVSAAGPIAFIGLIVPHLLRAIIGTNYKYILPLAAIYGAILLTLCDTLIRVVNPVSEIPVGILIGLIGTPFFVFVARYKTGGMS